MGSSIRLGKIFGIPIDISFSWIIIFALVTLSLSTYYFPSQYPAWSPAVTWTVGILTSLLFFISVLIHELSHSVVAMAQGTNVRSITLFIFGGVSKIGSEPKTARDELLMAVAGPAASMALAVFFAVLWLVTRSFFDPVASLSRWLAGINLSLALFNLIPGFPLDGGRVLRAVVWGTTGNVAKATRFAAVLGQIIAYLFIFGGFLMALRGNWDGLWIAFIGWFLENAASQSYRQVALRELLLGTKAGDLMNRECSYSPDDLPLDQFVHDHLLLKGERCSLITDEGRLVGIVTLHNIKEVPRAEWATTLVGRIMTPVSGVKRVQVTDDAASVLERMDEEDVNQLPVMDGNRVVGLIARDAMLRFIRTKSELGI